MALGARRPLRVVLPEGVKFGRAHVALARAAAQVCGAAWEGEVGGRVGALSESAPRGESHHVRLGLGMGVGRLLAAVVPAAGRLARGQTLRLVVEGSTHAPNAPTVDHWAHAMSPLLAALGVVLRVVVTRAGFPPAGGGAVAVEVEGGGGWRGAQWLARGPITERRATLWLGHLSDAVSARQARALSQRLSWGEACVEVRRADEALSAGNAVSLLVGDGRTRSVLAAVGELGIQAEGVAQGAISDLQRLLASGAPIDSLSLRHLLTPALLATAGGEPCVALCAPPDPVTRALLEVAPHFFEAAATFTRDVGDGQRAFWLRTGSGAELG
jgi:RNA 3'-terminal phosphate cyclase (ATP)